MRDPSALNVTADTELFIFKFPINCFVYVENHTPNYTQNSQKQKAQKESTQERFLGHGCLYVGWLYTIWELNAATFPVVN